MSGPAEVAFNMKPGQISGPINAGRSGVVFAVTERQEPSPDELAASKDRIRESLLQKKRQEVLENFASTCGRRWKREEKSATTKRNATS